jgi:two-component system, cell cycle sensor histidine kinase and response regulator CckA
MEPTKSRRSRKPVADADADVRKALERSNRALRLLSDAKQVLLRALEEPQLLRDLCELLVGAGGYRMAWVGLAEPGPAQVLRPAAHAGFEAGYLAEGPLSWAEGAGLVATALETGQPGLARAIAADPGFGARRAAAIERGYAAALALPLLEGGRRLGLLELYSAVPDAFDAPEVATLTELAADLAFGVSALRTRADRDRATAELRSVGDQREQVLGSIPDLISRFDAQARFVYVSPSVERSVGRPASVLLGRTPLEAGVCEDPAETRALQENLDRVLAGEPPARLEVSFKTVQGPRLHEVRHVPERDQQGRVTSVVAIATDLSERQAAVLSHALDQVAEGIFLFEDELPRIRYVNLNGARALGWSQEELTSGMTVLDIDPDLDEARWAAIMANQRERSAYRIESRHRTRQGRVYPIEVTGSAFTYGGRRYSVVITREITERRAAEEALRTREAAYRTLAENLPDLIFRWDRELRRTYVNPAVAAAMGAQPEAMAANEGAAAQLREMVKLVFDSGQPSSREMEWHLLGRARTYLSQAVPEFDARGQVTSVLGIARDITSLKVTERKFRTLAEHSPDIILRLDREGRYLYANEALERLVGRPTGDLLGQPFGSLTGDPAREPYASLRQEVAKVFGTGQAHEAEFQERLADGEHHFNLRLVPETGETGEVESVLAVLRDDTAQQRAEAALRASEQRFRQVTETIDEAFWLTDAARTELLYASPAFERVFGQALSELRAAPRSWLTRVHPEDRARVATALQAEDGYELEYRVVRADGVRWIHERAVPVRGEPGQVGLVAGAAIDVTLRRQLEDQLRQAQKMEAVGRLAGGIAHDFNNLLAVVELEATLLLDDPATAAGTRDGLTEILGAGRRAGNLTRQLLTFSRHQVFQPVDLDLGESIAELSKLLRRVLGESVALETRLATGLPRLHGDPGMMEQVVMNLAINARDAMPQGGRLLISLEPATIGAEQAATHPGAPPGPALCLAVTDTGAGISPQALPHIFEPFFTTKEVGKGTGLGLATVFSIVEQHHGWIEVESALGTGTTFRVLLPARPYDAEAAATASAVPRARGGGETVLLVEDERQVRASTRAGLERYGYRVLEADSGPAALELWAKAHPPVHLLLTDLVMPGGMSGAQLAETLLAEQPGLRVLYTSGYSPETVGPLLRGPGRALLQKPYSAQELARWVRRALDQEPGELGPA